MSLADVCATDLVHASDRVPGYCRDCGLAVDVVRAGAVLRAGICCYVLDDDACAECLSTRVVACDDATATDLESAEDDRRFALEVGRTAKGIWRDDMRTQAARMWAALRLAWRSYDREPCALHEAYAAAMVALEDSPVAVPARPGRRGQATENSEKGPATTRNGAGVAGVSGAS